MDDPIDRAYFEWLHEYVGIRGHGSRNTYNSFLHQLFTKEFLIIIRNDENRVEDGRELRYQFVRDAYITDVTHEWMNLNCSFLEMMIGLSKRLAFQADGHPSEWFWHLVENMGAYPCTDSTYRRKPETWRRIDNIMERIIHRSYYPNGRGGLFPLDHTHHDQRNVEIWFQMCEYLLERDPA